MAPRKIGHAAYFKEPGIGEFTAPGELAMYQKEQSTRKVVRIPAI